MDNSDSASSSPLLRVTAEISEIKESPHDVSSNKDEKCSISPPSVTSKEFRNQPILSRKKLLHPIYGNPYQARSNYAGSVYGSAQNNKNNVSAFTQRIMSAKLLRVKQLQNQLSETQIKLTEVLNENKLLKTLQRRQDNALKKYEGNQEQLPQLIKSHNEEIRILNSKYKQLRTNYRELESRMKQRDNELLNLKEQHKHLLQLSRDKHLGEREKLSKKVEELEKILKIQDQKVNNLNRKLELEEKNHRHQMNQEMMKHKETQNKLTSAQQAINTLKTSLEARDRFISTSYPRSSRGTGGSSQNPGPGSVAQPPRVSIRNPQRGMKPAYEEEDPPSPETTAHSYSMNYSPVAHDSTTESSEGSYSSRDDVAKENISVSFHSDRIKRNMNNKISVRKASRDGIKEEFFKFDKDVEKCPPDKDKIKVHNKKLSTNGVQPKEISHDKVQSKKKLYKTASRENNNGHQSSSTSQDKSDGGRSKEEENNENQEHKASQENSSKLSTPNSYLSVDMAQESNEETRRYNEMEKELEDEFNKIMKETRLVDENMLNLSQMVTRSEINDFEEKFKQFSIESIRKNTEKDINRIIDSAYGDFSSDETDSTKEEGRNDFDTYYNRWNKTSETTVMNRYDGQNNDHKLTKNDNLLEESKKVNLLKALNNIDKEEGGAESNVDGGHPTDTKQPESDETLIETRGTIRKSFSSSFMNTKRKTDIMNDIFGNGGTVL